jgi:hypothetical protein
MIVHVRDRLFFRALGGFRACDREWLADLQKAPLEAKRYSASPSHCLTPNVRAGPFNASLMQAMNMSLRSATRS